VTPTDLVFPFFLFAVGNALALVMPGLLRGRRRCSGPRGKRTALIFAIGLLLNAAPFVRWDAAGELVMRDLETLRLMGVLQRIALAWGAAALIVWPGRRARRGLGGGGAAAGLLGGLRGLGEAPIPTAWKASSAPRSTARCSASAPLPRRGRALRPRGPGQHACRRSRRCCWATWPARRSCAGAPGRGAGGAPLRGRLRALALAYAWQLQMPLNKKIWTSSYVLPISSSSVR
jgi:predicted acyltransferase